jgi:hypothetical protein
MEEKLLKLSQSELNYINVIVDGMLIAHDKELTREPAPQRQNPALAAEVERVENERGTYHEVPDYANYYRR